MSNRNAVLNGHRKRWQKAAADLDAAKLIAADAFAGIKTDLKASGFTKADVAGIKLAVRRGFETAVQRAARVEAEAIAEALAELGE